MHDNLSSLYSLHRDVLKKLMKNYRISAQVYVCIYYFFLWTLKRWCDHCDLFPQKK